MKGRVSRSPDRNKVEKWVRQCQDAGLGARTWEGDQAENAGEVLAGGWSRAWVTCHKLPVVAGVEGHNTVGS